MLKPDEVAQLLELVKLQKKEIKALEIALNNSLKCLQLQGKAYKKAKKARIELEARIYGEAKC